MCSHILLLIVCARTCTPRGRANLKICRLQILRCTHKNEQYNISKTVLGIFSLGSQYESILCRPRGVRKSSLRPNEGHGSRQGDQQGSRQLAAAMPDQSFTTPINASYSDIKSDEELKGEKKAMCVSIVALILSVPALVGKSPSSPPAPAAPAAGCTSLLSLLFRFMNLLHLRHLLHLVLLLQPPPPRAPAASSLLSGPLPPC